MRHSFLNLIAIAWVVVWLMPRYVPAQAPHAAFMREQSEALAFTDIDGNEHAIPCKKEARGIVLLFINTECPIANSYHPTLRRLREEFVGSEFDFAMVYADADLKVDAIRKHQKEFEITWPVVLDPGYKITRHVAAKVTPEAIIVGPKGEVLYRGRIDDRYQAYGRKRPEPSSHDLRNAMRAIVEGKPVPTPESVPIGCVIRLPD